MTVLVLTQICINDFCTTMRSSLFFDGFDRDGNGHFITDIRGIFAHVEIGAFDDRGRIGAAGVLFQNRMWYALERCHRQHHWFTDAFQSQHATHASELIAVEFQRIGLKGHGRIMSGIQKIGALNMLIEQGSAGIDRRSIDGHVYRAGFGLTIQHDFAGGFIETTKLGGIAKMAVGKTRQGMRAVNDESFWSSQYGGRK